MSYQKGGTPRGWTRGSGTGGQRHKNIGLQQINERWDAKTVNTRHTIYSLTESEFGVRQTEIPHSVTANIVKLIKNQKHSELVNYKSRMIPSETGQK